MLHKCVVFTGIGGGGGVAISKDHSKNLIMINGKKCAFCVKSRLIEIIDISMMSDNKQNLVYITMVKRRGYYTAVKFTKRNN